jgi:hypothetical protein
MKYLCVLFFDEKKLCAMSDQESQAMIDESVAYDESLRASGHCVVANAIELLHEATTVRVRGGVRSVTHGPFAATNEQIGGLILLDARDLNEAIRLASGIPSIRLGGVEVRPIQEPSHRRPSMLRNAGKAIVRGTLVLVTVLGAVWPIQAQSTYPSMAPIEQYRMGRDAEIALARTAAPPSVSRDADVLVLGQKNYETAVKGKNGFVCLVGRAFTGPLSNPEFWNPKNRSPMCYNPPAARSVVPMLLKETEMAFAGLSKAQISAGIKTAFDKKELGAPESGSMCYMLSKEAYLTDRGGHNMAHLMFELPRIDGAAWGADLAGTSGSFQDSPIFFVSFDPAPMTEFNVPMSQWSDGTDVTAHSP